MACTPWEQEWCPILNRGNEWDKLGSEFEPSFESLAPKIEKLSSFWFECEVPSIWNENKHFEKEWGVSLY